MWCRQGKIRGNQEVPSRKRVISAKSGTAFRYLNPADDLLDQRNLGDDRRQNQADGGADGEAAEQLD